MRAAFLDEARQDEVSHVVQDVLHREGALVSDHSSSRVLFHGYRPGGKHTWDRAGYIGIYQHAGEPEVEVRLRLRARWPWRLLWLSALINVLLVIATVATNPSGTVWFSVAALGAFLLITTGVLYVNTWKPVWREERALMEILEAELEKNVGAADLETAEERELRRLEEELEGELEKRRIRQARRTEAPTAGGRGGLPQFRMPRPTLLNRKSKPTAGDADATAAGAATDDEAASEARIAALQARREELLARKAELAARHGNATADGDDSDAPDAPAKRRLPVAMRMPKLALPKLGRKAKDADAADDGEETPEERRARLLARKAELEAERARDE